MKTRDIVLIAVTVILVGIMIGGFIYDRTPALLDRTNDYDFSQDENLKIIATEKKGLTFRRVYYEAKLRILNNYWEGYCIGIGNTFNFEGQMMTREEYLEYEQVALKNAQLKPVPAPDTAVWVGGVEYDDHANVYILDTEYDGNAYMYIYYQRK